MPDKSKKLGAVHNQKPGDTQHTFTDEDISLILAEFNVQREEILKRVELQHLLLLFATTAFGTILTLGFQTQSATLILLYPWLAMFLSLAWAANSLRVKEMQLYIAWFIESKGILKDIGWEWFRTKIQRGRFDIMTTFWESAWGFFVGTQIVAWIVGVVAVTVGVPPMKASFNPSEKYSWVLISFIVLDLLCILFTFFRILRPIRIKIDGQE